MIEIALLGPVSVSVHGRPLEGEASQRKRLAVLSLLAVPPLAAVPRERVMAYVWPDRDAESARHLLSASLHVLRKALGPDAFVTTGDQLSLDPSRVTVDVAGFEDAVERQDWAGAVARYGGPFLDGFNPGAGADLDQWIDAHRARLERRYGQALRGLADARSAAGDGAGAVEAWRKLAALDPYDAGGALGLMEALAAVGNRAAAIQHARIHAQLLGSEFDAAPNAEVVALAEALRTSPDPVSEAETVHPAANVDLSIVPDTAGDPAPERPERNAAAGPGVDTSAGSVSARWRGYEGGAIIVVAVVLIAVVAGLGLMWGRPASGVGATPRTVAVLPFTLPGADATDRYLGDGIAEQVLDELGRVQGLRVVARASSFAYRDRTMDVREIGRALAATHILEGSVARSGNTVRIWVQLVDAEHTGYRVWSQTYDRPSAELFALQDEIAREVATALEVRLGPGEAPEHRPSLEAFDLYLRGRHAWLKRSPASLEQARDLFQRAITLDSLYALAWVGLADSYAMLGSYDYGGLPPTQAYEEARRAVGRALRLQPNLAAAHAVLANIHMNYDWDWTGAEREFRHALEINPGYGQARQWYALLLTARGRPEEAALQLQRAAELDPASPVMLATRAHCHLYQRDWTRARVEAEAALELNPTFSRAHLLLALLDLETGRPHAAVHRARALVESGGREPIVVAVLSHALAAAGDTVGARAEIDRLLVESRNRYIPHEAFAIAWLGLGEHERAIASLEQAYDQRSGVIVYLTVEPLADPLRGYPRFQRLLARRPA